MVLVTVSEGVLEGLVEDNEYGGVICSFRGVPYAEPPLGDLRFKAPQPKAPWTGVRSAKTLGPMCYQLDSIDHQAKGQEDCLYLNVFSPNMTPDKPLPVMFWIHGGATKYGNGNDTIYGPHFLLKHGVVLVTINFRLEALGFLCLHSKDIPGNAGLKDQVAALRWVKKNISNFGGDPDNVTIFGESAGASNISFHLVSPMTKGLFKRAIMQSGSALNWWTMPYKPRERALALARKLGCKSENDHELYNFLKTVPVESLVDLDLPIIQLETGCKYLYLLYFGAVSEEEYDGVERYFHGDSYEALSKNIHEGVEIITGYNEHEGVLPFIFEADPVKIVDELNMFQDLLCPTPILLNCSIEKQMEVSKKFKKFYNIDSSYTKKNILNIVRYFSANIFTYSIVQNAKLYSKRNRVFMYKFSCKSENNIFSIMTKLTTYFGSEITSHTDDTGYLFYNKLMHRRLSKNSRSFQMIDRLTKMWTDFAKYGNPTPNNELGALWSPYTTQDRHYFDIGNEIFAKTDVDGEEMQFWENIFREYLPKYVCE